METPVVPDPRLAAAAADPAGPLAIRRVGERLLLETSEASLHRARRQVRAGSLLATASGLIAAALTPWGWLLTAAGLAALWIAPRHQRPRRLLEIDPDRACIRPGPGSGNVEPVPLASVRAIRGAYETQGWDPRSVIWVLGEDGQETPVLALPGTDEALAVEACRLLGLLLDCPATYAGPFGAPTTCHPGEPRRQESPVPSA